MAGSRIKMAAAVLAGAATCSWSCGGRPVLDDGDLLQLIKQFEERTAGKTPDQERALLEEFGTSLVGRRFCVDSAVVAATYLRENESHIYFGTTYNPNEHVYLSALDPELDEFFRHHRYWASAVATYPERQVSYELAVSPEEFESLTNGETISFDATLATVIRGKSIYCRARSIRKISG